MNPEVLGRALPGCAKLERNGDGSYHAEMSVGIAAVKGTYHGHIEILEGVPPERFRLRVEGKGASGFLKGEGVLTLADSDPETIVTYSGEAHVGGIIASVGQRLILGAARQIVNRFFEAFAKQFQKTPSPTDTPAPTVPQP